MTDPLAMRRSPRWCLAAVLVALAAAGSANQAAADEPVGASAAAADAALVSAPSAGDASQALATPPASRSQARNHKPLAPRTVAQVIEGNVRRLSRGLDLDERQQASLRQILMDQHRQMVALRNGSNPAAQSDVAGTSLAIYDQTRSRIRSILNDVQRDKYAADVPRNELAPAQADLQHWIEVQDAGRRQGIGEEAQK